MHDDTGHDGHVFYALPETLRELGLPREARLMRVASDDMEPFVRTGDLVIYDPRVNRIHANGVFVLQAEEKLIVRRAQRGMKQTVRLICDNRQFGDEILSDADFTDHDTEDGRIVVVGYVVGRALMGR